MGVQRHRKSREEFVPRLEAFFLLLRAQRGEPGPGGVENRSRRQLQADQIVAILPGQNQVVLPAIEGPANQRPPLIDGAAVFAEIHARSVRRRFEKKDGFARAAGYCAGAVRVRIITLLRMKKQPLAASAAFDAAIARNVGWMFCSQPSF